MCRPTPALSADDLARLRQQLEAQQQESSEGSHSANEDGASGEELQCQQGGAFLTGPLRAPESGCPQHVLDIIARSAQSWLRNEEINDILNNWQHYGLQTCNESPNKPPGGTLYLFDRNAVRYFRKDGHAWRKKTDGRSVRETHEKLKVSGSLALNCYYAHSTDNKLQRRSYWLLDNDVGMVLVHYTACPSTRRAILMGAPAEAGAGRSRVRKQQRRRGRANATSSDDEDYPGDTDTATADDDATGSENNSRQGARKSSSSGSRGKASSSFGAPAGLPRVQQGSLPFQQQQQQGGVAAKPASSRPGASAPRPPHIVHCKPAPSAAAAAVEADGFFASNGRSVNAAAMPFGHPLQCRLPQNRSSAAGNNAIGLLPSPSTLQQQQQQRQSLVSPFGAAAGNGSGSGTGHGKRSHEEALGLSASAAQQACKLLRKASAGGLMTPQMSADLAALMDPAFLQSLGLPQAWQQQQQQLATGCTGGTQQGLNGAAPIINDTTLAVLECLMMCDFELPLPEEDVKPPPAATLPPLAPLRAYDNLSDNSFSPFAAGCQQPWGQQHMWGQQQQAPPLPLQPPLPAMGSSHQLSSSSTSSASLLSLASGAHNNAGANAGAISSASQRLGLGSSGAMVPTPGCMVPQLPLPPAGALCGGDMPFAQAPLVAAAQQANPHTAAPAAAAAGCNGRSTPLPGLDLSRQPTAGEWHLDALNLMLLGGGAPGAGPGAANAESGWPAMDSLYGSTSLDDLVA